VLKQQLPAKPNLISTHKYVHVDGQRNVFHATWEFRLLIKIQLSGFVTRTSRFSTEQNGGCVIPSSLNTLTRSISVCGEFEELKKH